MTAIVLDPGCGAATSHNAAVNYALRDVCRDSGRPYAFFYSAKAEPRVKEELAGYPVMESFVPYGIGNRPEDMVNAFQRVVVLFHGDLVERLQPLLEPGDMLVMHTVTAAHVFALNGWLEQLEMPLKVRIVLRFHPGFRATAEQAQFSEMAYVQALKSLVAGAGRHDVKLFADSEILAELYRGLIGCEVTAAPIPINFNYFQERPVVPGRRRIGYLGEMRSEKGFDLLGEALRTTLSRHPEASFFIQVPQLSPDRAATLDTAGGRIEWVTGAMLPPQYYETMLNLDALLIAYDKREYTYRTSHIFVESVGFGKPVVTMEGSWMHEEMKRMPVMPGAVSQAFTGWALGEAVCDLLDRWDEYSANARQVAPAWREFHNIRNFASVLLV